MGNEKFRILMISPQFHPLVGGYERAAKRLSEELVRVGHNVSVATEQRNKDWPVFEKINGVNVYRIRCIYKSGLHTLTTIIGFTFFLVSKGRSYDVWHIHQQGKLAICVIFLSKILRVPVILKQTSTKSQGILSILGNSLFSKIGVYLLKKADFYISLTKEMEYEALTFGISKNKIRIISNSGVDINEFKPIDKDKKELLKKQMGLLGKNIVLYVGRLSKEKNPDGLIKSWQFAIKHISDDWILLIVGDGPMRNELNRYVDENQLDNSVIFLGINDNVAQWMQASNLFVLPSWHEGLSNTLLEALASGLPVICTRVSGVNELVEIPRSGIVVETGDMHGFSLALVKLCSSESSRLHAGVLGRNIVLENYSTAYITEAYKTIYKKLIIT